MAALYGDVRLVDTCGFTFQAIDYAEGLVRVGVQSEVERPEAAKLIRQLMQERHLPAPPAGRTLNSICVVALCQRGTSLRRSGRVEWSEVSSGIG